MNGFKLYLVGGSTRDYLLKRDFIEFDVATDATPNDMEEFLEKKVFLETYVKTLKNWRDQERYFVELGLKDEDE